MLSFWGSNQCLTQLAIQEEVLTLIDFLECIIPIRLAYSCKTFLPKTSFSPPPSLMLLSYKLAPPPYINAVTPSISIPFSVHYIAALAPTYLCSLFTFEIPDFASLPPPTNLTPLFQLQRSKYHVYLAPQDSHLVTLPWLHQTFIRLIIWMYFHIQQIRQCNTCRKPFIIWEGICWAEGTCVSHMTKFTINPNQQSFHWASFDQQKLFNKWIAKCVDSQHSSTITNRHSLFTTIEE